MYVAGIDVHTIQDTSHHIIMDSTKATKARADYSFGAFRSTCRIDEVSRQGDIDGCYSPMLENTDAYDTRQSRDQIFRYNDPDSPNAA